MKVIRHLMSNWVKRCPHEVSGAIITQCMVLSVPWYFSMVLAKGDYGTWFSLSHGIGFL